MEADSKADQVDGCRDLEIVASVEVPKPKRYSPPPCSSCTALREPNTNYTHVRDKPIIRDGYLVRYLKCKWCNNTWKDVQKLPVTLDDCQE